MATASASSLWRETKCTFDRDSKEELSSRTFRRVRSSISAGSKKEGGCAGTDFESIKISLLVEVEFLRDLLETDCDCEM